MAVSKIPRNPDEEHGGVPANPLRHSAGKIDRDAGDKRVAESGHAETYSTGPSADVGSECDQNPKGRSPDCEWKGDRHKGYGPPGLLLPGHLAGPIEPEGFLLAGH